jgi:thiol-disulfide isomerase/thioredoxin
VKKVLVLLAMAALVAISLPAADKNTVRKAPELAFTVGQEQKLLSQYRGKIVALEFIFTTCPHCQAWAKTMSKFQQEFGSRGFQAIDVAVNDNADLLVGNFAKEFQVNFPVGWTLRDQAVSFMGFSSAYFVVPQLALIDRKGYIHYQTPAKEEPGGDWDKLMKEDVIRQHIEELLSQNTSASRTPTNNARVVLAKER